MMELKFALLAACICIGLSSGYDIDVHYGGSETFRIPSRAHYLHFQKRYDSEKLYLWTRDRPSQTRRGSFDGWQFVMESLTQADNGIYTTLTKSNRTVSTYTVNVLHHTTTYEHREGEDLHMEFPVDLKLGTLTYSSEDGVVFVIPNNRYEWNEHFESRLEVARSSNSIDIRDLQARDSGVFVLRDLKRNLIMTGTLRVTAAPFAWDKVGIAAGVVSALVSCCCCVKRCCCGKSSEEDTSPAESPDDVQLNPAAPSLPKYTAEPGPPGYAAHGYTYQPAKAADSAPSPKFERCAPASLHVAAPPPVPAPATGQAAAQEVSFASSFQSSDIDPCFELKGMTLAPPLGSESTSAEVYTSDKLNFGFL